MKRNNKLALVLATMIFALTGCQAIGDIFKAGFWSAIIVVIVVVVIILWLVNKSKK